jgi:hypothetical protein
MEIIQATKPRLPFVDVTDASQIYSQFPRSQMTENFIKLTNEKKVQLWNSKEYRDYYTLHPNEILDTKPIVSGIDDILKHKPIDKWSEKFIKLSDEEKMNHWKNIRHYHIHHPNAILNAPRIKNTERKRVRDDDDTDEEYDEYYPRVKKMLYLYLKTSPNTMTFEELKFRDCVKNIFSMCNICKENIILTKIKICDKCFDDVQEIRNANDTN